MIYVVQPIHLLTLNKFRSFVLKQKNDGQFGNLARHSWGTAEAQLGHSWGTKSKTLGHSWGTAGAQLGHSWGIKLLGAQCQDRREKS